MEIQKVKSFLGKVLDGDKHLHIFIDGKLVDFEISFGLDGIELHVIPSVKVVKEIKEVVESPVKESKPKKK
jgi:hypothetical protein